MVTPPSGRSTVVRRAFRVVGAITNVGFRPYVFKLASNLQLVGFVADAGIDERGRNVVAIEVEGPVPQVTAFEDRLKAEAPPKASIDDIKRTEQRPRGEEQFVVSRHRATQTQSMTPIPPDAGPCPQCSAEVDDPADRRYRYPFCACDQCGPRFSIITGPGGSDTTAARFEPCETCKAEQAASGSRRARTPLGGCPQCGPQLGFLWPPTPDQLKDPPVEADGDAALRRAQVVLMRGGVLALKDTGGYRLVADATNASAVRRLRKRSGRPHAPLIVIVPDMEVAGRLVHLSDQVTSALTAASAPAVLAPVADSDDAREVAEEVTPGLAKVAVELPPSMLTRMLMLPAEGGDFPPALVTASGNRSGEPPCVHDAQAFGRLADVADAFLVSTLDVAGAAEDTIIDVVDNVARPLRLGRGSTPTAIDLPLPAQATLAVGFDTSAALTLALGTRAYLGPHRAGNTAPEELTAASRHLASLFSTTPRTLAADSHPDSAGAAWARKQTNAQRPCLLVQHHHSMVAGVMATNGIEQGTQVIGFVFDHPSPGTDGTQWGGDVLVCDYQNFRRVSYLSPIPLPVQNPDDRVRAALAHSWAAGMEWTGRLADMAGEDLVARARLRAAFDDHKTGDRPTSAMSRLLDAVAVLCGLGPVTLFPGHTQAQLDALCDEEVTHAYPFAIPSHDGPLRAGPMLAAAVEDLEGGLHPSRVVAGVYNGIADMTVQVAERLRASQRLYHVMLAGAVFRSNLLTDKCRRLLEAEGFNVGHHMALPVGDEAASLGQVVLAAAKNPPRT